MKGSCTLSDYIKLFRFSVKVRLRTNADKRGVSIGNDVDRPDGLRLRWDARCSICSAKASRYALASASHLAAFAQRRRLGKTRYGLLLRIALRHGSRLYARLWPIGNTGKYPRLPLRGTPSEFQEVKKGRQNSSGLKYLLAQGEYPALMFPLVVGHL